MKKTKDVLMKFQLAYAQLHKDEENNEWNHGQLHAFNECSDEARVDLILAVGRDPKNGTLIVDVMQSTGPSPDDMITALSALIESIKVVSGPSVPKGDDVWADIRPGNAKSASEIN